MWVSKQTKKSKDNSGSARVGVVTAGGQESGVYLGTQRCWLPVLAPGGYRWRPAVGDQVLVLKAGGERESPCVVGKPQGEADLQPGEVRLLGEASSVSLLGKTVGLNGRVEVNGVELEDLIAAIVIDILSEGEG